MKSVGHLVYTSIALLIFMFRIGNADFGDFCNETIECNAGSLLKCNDSSLCQCANDQTMIYDKTKLKCVSKVGQKCQILTSDATETGNGNGITDAPQCPTNANGGSTLTCSCDRGFFFTENGLCESQRNFSEPCTRDDQCRYDGAFLTCVNGSCGCEPTKLAFKATVEQVVVVGEEVEIVERVRWGGTNMYRAKYGDQHYVAGKWVRGTRDRSHGFVLVKKESWTTKTLDQCVGLAGQECNSLSNCVSHSTCNEGTCSCSAGFSQKSNGRCGAIHNNRCTLVMPCADGLVCISGDCKCPDATNQEYHNDTQRCLGNIHAFCSADSDCTENSVCTVNPNSGKKQCTCAVGFLQTTGRKCERGTTLGSPCTFGGGAPLVGGDTCPGELECRDGVCDCPESSTIFHSKLRRCVGLVGAKCYLRRVATNERIEVETASVVPLMDQICVDGAFCEQHLQDFPGQCVCKLGYKFTEEGFCTPVYCNKLDTGD